MADTSAFILEERVPYSWDKRLSLFGLPSGKKIRMLQLEVDPRFFQQVNRQITDGNMAEQVAK